MASEVSNDISNPDKSEADNFAKNPPIGIKENFSSSAQLSDSSILLLSWNLRDFGDSKNDDEVNFIAEVVKRFDVIAIQEVVAGLGGPKAVARLVDNLNRKGAKWDYVISDPTSGNNSYKRERYAFVWKPNKVKKMGDAWLEKQYNLEIDREPFFATFSKKGRTFTLVNFHAITKSMQPETEIKFFKFLPNEYPGNNLIFSGDFNCPQSHSVFNPLKKMGYKPILNSQRTSLKKSCIGDDCLASELDNIFFNESKVNLIKSDIIHFYKSYETLEDALKISDHTPVVFEFSVN